jgi:hypothetical protein
MAIMRRTFRNFASRPWWWWRNLERRRRLNADGAALDGQADGFSEPATADNTALFLLLLLEDI